MDKARNAISIFYSYAHADRALRDELDRHLGTLKRLGKIVGWHDYEILPGNEWKRDIENHLVEANIILLLISADFIASDYCYGIEMNKAMELHQSGRARVIPILLRSVDWEDTPFADLDILPAKGMPILSSYWHDRDEGFYQVVVGIRKVITDLLATSTPQSLEKNTKDTVLDLLRELEAPDVQVLCKRYQVQDVISRGNMATIYRGHDRHKNQDVAIKLFSDVSMMDSQFINRFTRIVISANSLTHPNVIKIYDCGQEASDLYIIMELLEGVDLRRYLKPRGILASDRVLIIAHDVALGLGAAHRRKIIHCNVKPRNIFVCRTGDIKIGDFMLSTFYNDIKNARITTTGTTMDSVWYYSPEQILHGHSNLTPASDIYSLGVVMYEMLTGRLPFDGRSSVEVAMKHSGEQPVSPSQFNPNIYPGLEDIVLRCLEKLPVMRFRDGLSLARAIEVGNWPTS